MPGTAERLDEVFQQDTGAHTATEESVCSLFVLHFLGSLDFYAYKVEHNLLLVSAGEQITQILKE